MYKVLKIIFWMIDWYSIYTFIFITVFALFSFKAIPGLKAKQLYREAIWLKRGLYLIMTLDLLLFSVPRLILFFLPG